LASEWEKRRVPLVDAYRQLRDKLTNTSDDAKNKLEKIKEMRKEMKAIADDVRGKEEKYRALLESFEGLPKDVSRAHYTDRILEIVKNVKKQKVDIDKVLVDTRTISKEINNVSDTLNRTFAMVDEMVYQDASNINFKEIAVAKDVYKQVVAMNETFKKLVKSVDETGQTLNVTLLLEAKIDSLDQRVKALNFERIENDLKEIKEENRLLLTQVLGLTVAV